MKKIFFSLITISLFFASCIKENQDVQEMVHLGNDAILTYSDEIINPFDCSVTIDNKNYNYNRIVAQYLSVEQNQNLFFVNLVDTVKNTGIGLGIYTPPLKVDDFFKISSINIDKLNVYWLGKTEKFDNVNAKFSWEYVSFNNRKFNGKATFELTKNITGKVNSSMTFPVQKITFEFK